MDRRRPNHASGFRMPSVRVPDEPRVEKPVKKEAAMGRLLQQEETIGNLLSEVRILKQKLAFLQKIKFSLLDEDPISEGDVTFIVKNKKEIRAHRFMLASKSSIFRKMFDTDMREKTSGEIHIEDISAPILQAMIGFLYTAEITFTQEATAVDVFKVAHRYDIPELQAQCEIELLKSVSAQNVSEMLKISYIYGIGSLKAKSTKIFKENFDQVHSQVISDLLS